MAELSPTTKNGEIQAEVSGHQNTKNIDKNYIFYIFIRKSCYIISMT
jgi:hypothetical protein